MKFQISGTTNQVSEQTAGQWYVQTQVAYTASGPFYNIDQGKFDSGFTTTKGAIAPTKSMEAETYITWNKNQAYYLHLSIYYYIPVDGKIKIIFPVQCVLESPTPTIKMY